MNNQHFSKDDFKKFETPMQKLMHLNLKALKSFSDFNAEDLFHGKEPSNAWKKHMEVFLKNSQKGLIYLQGVFSLMEEHLAETASQAKKASSSPKTKKTAAAKKPAAMKKMAAAKKPMAMKKMDAAKKPLQ